MGLPKKQVKPSIPLNYPKTLLPRREEIKDMIKLKAGLNTSDGELKSFADCSKEELSLAIQAALQLGEQVDFPLE